MVGIYLLGVFIILNIYYIFLVKIFRTIVSTKVLRSSYTSMVLNTLELLHFTILSVFFFVFSIAALNRPCINYDYCSITRVPFLINFALCVEVFCVRIIFTYQILINKTFTVSPLECLVLKNKLNGHLKTW